MEGSLSQILQWLPGVMGALIAWLGYKLSRQQSRESWLRTYKDLHEAFWSDPDFREIRAWLACDAAYSRLCPILSKRRQIDEGVQPALSLTEDEYAQLERLDRFLNFLMRVVVVNPEFKRQKSLWTKLYFDYWLAQFGRATRSELTWYLQRFYPDLAVMLPESVSRYGLVPADVCLTIKRK